EKQPVSRSDSRFERIEQLKPEKKAALKPPMFFTSHTPSIPVKSNACLNELWRSAVTVLLRQEPTSFQCNGEYMKLPRSWMIMASVLVVGVCACGAWAKTLR